MGREDGKAKKKEITEEEVLLDLEADIIDDASGTQLVTLVDGSQPSSLTSEEDEFVIQYRVDNQKFTGNGSYYEFDIYGKALQDGTYLGDVILPLKYNTEVFGSNAGISGITSTPGPEYDTEYYFTMATDYLADEFFALLTATTTDVRPTPVRKLMKTNEYELLMHIKMEIPTPACGSSTKLAFDHTYLSDHPDFNTYATAPSSGELNFDQVKLESFTPLTTCKVYLFEITSSRPVISAGTDTEITITGSNFGDTRGTGAVWFTSADIKDEATPDKNYIRGLDPYDYVSWSDNTIVVKVPSVVVNSSANELNGAGSGPVRVYNSAGGYATSEPITIQYSRDNKVSDDGVYKDLMYVKDYDAAGGITFRLGLGASDHPQVADIRTSVQRALDDWSCVLDIDLKLGEDIATGGAYDNQNVIYMTGSLPSEKLMRTSTDQFACGSTVNGSAVQNSAFYKDTDIAINQSKIWNFKHSTTTSGSQFDFHHVLLHEIGHALGLGHINSPQEIMQFSFKKGELGGIHYGTGTVIGAENIVESSKEREWRCSGGWQTLSDAVVGRDCGLITGDGDKINVTPNKTIFTPGDNFNIDGAFVSADGDTRPDSWHWSVQLYHSGGKYKYAGLDLFWPFMNYTWKFTSKTTLPDYSWVRTSNGGIKGFINVYTKDNNGDFNVGSVDIELNYKPNRAEISELTFAGESAHLKHYSAGATTYKVYYGTSPGVYNGTGLVQGSSPVNIGANVTTTLSGLSPYNDYYFSVKGVNAYGESDYSEPVFVPRTIPAGADMAHPIHIGALASGIKVSDSQNNTVSNNFGSNYSGPNHQPSDDIFYKFTLPQNGTVTLETCGSSTDAYIHLLNAAGSHIASSSSGEEFCYPGTDPDPSQASVPTGGSAYLTRNLNKGDYFLVVEGNGNISGNITTGFKLDVMGYLHNVQWVDLFRASVNGTSVINTNSTYGWKSAAASYNRIGARESGWVEFTAADNSTPRMIGLSTTNWNGGTDWSKHWSSIQYNMYLGPSGTVSIYEKGVLKAGSAGTYKAGDKIKIERAGSSIYYKVNETTLYTSSCGIWDSFIIDMCLNMPSDKFKDVKTTAVPQTLSQTALVTKIDYPIAEPDWSDSTSLEPLFTDNLRVYPNPGQSNTTLHFNSEYKMDFEVSVVSEETGRKLATMPWAIVPGDNKLEMRIKELKAGYYRIVVNLGNKSHAIKFQKL